MSDHTPVLFNVFEDWNEESVVLYISLVSFVDYSTPDSIPILKHTKQYRCMID